MLKTKTLNFKLLKMQKYFVYVIKKVNSNFVSLKECQRAN